jgi:hypothetical protein
MSLISGDRQVASYAGQNLNFSFIAQRNEARMKRK